MSQRFNASALKLIEDALSDCFYSHRDLDSFLVRSGVTPNLLNAARNKAEARKGTWDRAPKRFVAQEVIDQIEQ